MLDSQETNLYMKPCGKVRVSAYLNAYTLCVGTAKALIRLCECGADLSLCCLHMA